MALSFAAALFAQAYAIAAFVSPGTLPVGDMMGWLGFWINMPGTAVIALFLPLLFPDGRLPSPRWRPVAWLAAALAIVAILSTMFAPGSYSNYPAIRNVFGIEAWAPLFELLDQATTAVFFALIGITAVALFSRLRHADPEERLQIRWFVYAGAIVAVGFLVDLAAGIFPDLKVLANILAVVAVTALPTAVGIAILRYRLYDIDVIVNRTLVYVALTGILAGVYAAIVASFQRIFVALTGESSELAIVLTLFVLTTVFTPVKHQLQTAVDRYVQPVARAGAPAGARGAVNDLQALADLHARGILTDDEFAAKKKQVLGI